MLDYNVQYTTVAALVAVIVAAIAYWRITSVDRWFAPNARFWFPLRRWLTTPVDRLLEPVPALYATTTTSRAQHVATVDVSLEDLHADLVAAGYEPQPLASVADDWEGREERSSWARYRGPKLGARVLPDAVVDALPGWTRRYQVHVRPFADRAEGPVTVTAHHEYNPWYVPRSIHHLLGIGIDTERGVRLVERDLEVVGRTEAAEETDTPAVEAR